MVIEGVNNLLGQCNVLIDQYDDEIELTEDVIKEILEYVDNVKEICF